MANIGHFMIPADDIDRAKRFYHTLLGLVVMIQDTEGNLIGLWKPVIK